MQTAGIPEIIFEKKLSLKKISRRQNSHVTAHDFEFLSKTMGI